jgi:tetraacyldisaccharide 4'-kinase
LTGRIVASWYRPSAIGLALRPLSWLFRAGVGVRREAYRRGWLRSRRLPVPVIVVGNLTVGGTGKTPLVIWLVELLRRHGLSPGVVSRGYRGKARHWPQQVRPDSDPVMAGDEAVVLARRCRCPVAVGPDRVAAARALLEHHRCDVIVSDDGLQHYALARDVEIVVVDGVRRFGNGHCLPAGPLREPLARLRAADFVVINEGAALPPEYAMAVAPTGFVNLRDEARREPPGRFAGRKVHAVAGIGHPERFFRQLAKLRLDAVPHAFADHHAFEPADLAFGDDLPVVMTEKDAVKCRRFCGPDCWYLAIEARPEPRFEARLLSMVRDLRHDTGLAGGTAATE